MANDTKNTTKTLSLTAKRAYVAKTRSINYRSSLRLEGFDLPDDTETVDERAVSKQQIIDKYRLTAG
ncbi:YhfG family protein [Aestuariirhabdus sp. LZHN29]|uniref:YhfG family protein n=1 Tax=Aestuariirhabdus sp. LZHN29 TaxID=3417462 RepID=UPI003CEB93B8